ncbi:MAG: hypothetical protein ACUVSM_08660 [Armatimonadota bacterium]
MTEMLTEWTGRLSRRRGAAIAAALVWLGLLSMMGTGIVSFSTSGTTRVISEERRAEALAAADGGLQREIHILWIPFRAQQKIQNLDAQFTGAGPGTSAKLVTTGTLPNGTRYVAAVVGYESVNSRTRRFTIQSVGWCDTNGNGVLDQGEVSRAVEALLDLTLDPSNVFDYAYFVNNYGWLDGFGASDLIVNGDMRANADFSILNGSPTINGSVYACRNDKLWPHAAGIVNRTPQFWTNSYYSSKAPQQARQAYQQSRMGVKGSDQFEAWRDLIYDADASMIYGRPAGAVIGDVNGIRRFDGTILDPRATKELPMPDLNDVEYYKQISRNYLDTKRKFRDNSNNPYYNEPAFIEVFNPSTNKYERITNQGVFEGSVALIGTTAKPIRIHGPVTVTGDIVIKGVFTGQGTLYAGRNVHIVGNVQYAQGPNFSGNDLELIDKANEKKDLLALCARGSIIMGNTKTMSSTTLSYMTPPFTKGRYDDFGNWIPPYNAKEIDEYGVMRYKSLLGDNYINSISENVNVINAILYTNFLGGGEIGGGSQGVTFNGSIICRDEAMVTRSLPMYLNYDTRVKWRIQEGEPLVDINLPFSPMARTRAWREI